MSHLKALTSTNCYLVILPENQADSVYLSNLFQSVTHVSDLWNSFIEIEDTNKVGAHRHQPLQITSPKGTSLCGQDEKVPTQTLSVNFLFRTEVVGRRKIKSIQEALSSEPWHFHHKFQIIDSLKGIVVALQEFYELSPMYPLLAVSSTRQGPSVMRINVFVKWNFSAMRSFYSRLLDMPPSYQKDGFCYFSLTCQLGFEVQLSLKYSSQLLVGETRNTMLRFSITSLYERIQNIGAKFDSIFCSECGILAIKDPEQNTVLVHGSAPACYNLRNRQPNYGHFGYSHEPGLRSRAEVYYRSSRVPTPAPLYPLNSLLGRPAFRSWPPQTDQAVTGSRDNVMTQTSCRSREKTPGKWESASTEGEYTSCSSVTDTDLEVDDGQSQNEDENCTLCMASTDHRAECVCTELSSDCDKCSSVTDGDVAYRDVAYGDVAYACCVAHI